MSVATDKYGVDFGGRDKLSPMLKRMGASLATFVGGFAAFQGIKSLLADSVQAAMETERVYNDLAASIERHGGVWEDVEGVLRSFTGEMQRTTGISDEVIAQSTQMLLDMGNSGKQAMELVRVSADLAAGGFMDMKAATDLVAKASVGYTGTLSRYGIILDESLPKSEKFAAAIASINEKFAGAAAARMETYAGKIALLTERWGDLKEAVGKGAIGPLGKFFEQLSIAADKVRVAMGGGTTLEELYTAQQDAVDDLRMAFERMNAIQGVAQSDMDRWNKIMPVTAQMLTVATEEYHKQGAEVRLLAQLITKLTAAQDEALDRNLGAKAAIEDEKSLIEFMKGEKDLIAQIRRGLSDENKERNQGLTDARDLLSGLRTEMDDGFGDESVLDRLVGDADEAAKELTAFQESAQVVFANTQVALADSIWNGMKRGRFRIAGVFKQMAQDFTVLFIDEAIKALTKKFVVKMLGALSIFDKFENDQFAMRQGRDFAKFFGQGVTGELGAGRFAGALGSPAATLAASAFPFPSGGGGDTIQFHFHGPVTTDDAQVRRLMSRIERASRLRQTSIMTRPGGRG